MVLDISIIASRCRILGGISPFKRNTVPVRSSGKIVNFMISSEFNSSYVMQQVFRNNWCWVLSNMDRSMGPGFDQYCSQRSSRPTYIVFVNIDRA